VTSFILDEFEGGDFMRVYGICNTGELSEVSFGIGRISVVGGEISTDDEFSDVMEFVVALIALAVVVVLTSLAVGIVLTTLAVGVVLTTLAVGVVLATVRRTLAVERIDPFEAVDSSDASTIGSGVEDTSFLGASYCHDFNSL
jgi:hypothetical protein